MVLQHVGRCDISGSQAVLGLIILGFIGKLSDETERYNDNNNHNVIHNDSNNGSNGSNNNDNNTNNHIEVPP